MIFSSFFNSLSNYKYLLKVNMNIIINVINNKNKKVGVKIRKN